MAGRRRQLEEEHWDLPEDRLERSLVLRNEEWNMDPGGPPYMEEAALLPDASGGGEVVDGDPDHPIHSPGRQWTRSPARTRGGALSCPKEIIVEWTQERIGELSGNVEYFGVPFVV